MAVRRLGKELEALQSTQVACVHEVTPDEANVLHWKVLLVPEKKPYDKGAFEVELTFPEEYPFKPPVVKFKTPIYHPNVEEKDGKICLPIASPEQWKPAVKVHQILEELVKMVHEPEPSHPLRADLAEIFVNDRAKFDKLAEEHAKKNAAKRPK